MGRNDGRQCVFVSGQNNNRIVSKGGKADFLMSGRVMMIDPDGSLARMRGHYSIRETGIENMLNRLAKTVAQESQVTFHLARPRSKASFDILTSKAPACLSFIAFRRASTRRYQTSSARVVL